VTALFRSIAQGDSARTAQLLAATPALATSALAVDTNGTACCAGAVRVLLDAGADPAVRNGKASTQVQLAEWTTGRGGSGSPQANEERTLNSDTSTATDPAPPGCQIREGCVSRTRHAVVT